MLDPEIESHYGIGYERSRLFPGGSPSLEFVRSMELLARLLPPPPARLLDVGGGPGTYAAPLARRGYRVRLVDPVELHVEQARQAAGSDPAATFTAVVGDARQLSEPDQSQDAVVKNCGLPTGSGLRCCPSTRSRSTIGRNCRSSSQP